MSNQNNNYGWIGWALAAVIGITFIFSFKNSSNETNQSTQSISSQADDISTNDFQVQNTSLWHCVDATSYNQNAFDDNKCTKGNETKYVSDSQAVELDPNYSPGKAGAAYYNNQ